MKTNLRKWLSLAIVLFTAGTLHAQTWNLTGNAGTTPGTNFIGTTDSKALYFKTNSNTRIVVTSSGKVGIGTTAPSAKLQVEGSAGTIDLFRFSNDKNTTKDSIMVMTSSGSVGIGTSTPSARLHVTSTGATDVLIAENKGTSDITAIYGKSNPLDYFGTGGFFEGGFTGCYGLVNSHDTVNTDRFYTGTVGEIFDLVGYGTNHGTGVAGQASGNLENTGVFAAATSTNAQMVSYGIHAYGNVIGGGTAYAGFFEGNLTYTGILSGPSDLKLKENISPLTGSLDLLMKLKPASYDYQYKKFTTMNLPQGRHFGLIAQETELVIPEIITNNIKPTTYDRHNKKVLSEKMEFKGINYVELIPILISGMQEQQKQIEYLQKQIKDLITQASHTPLESINAAASSYILDQNIPNPLSEITYINYRVPVVTKNTYLVIYSAEGKQMLRNQIITQNGEIEINMKNFMAGIYNYCIEVAGRQMASKQMVLTK